MYWIKEMQNAIEFIEGRLFESLVIEDVAKSANSSPANFQRIFSIVTGMTAGDYIRVRRLSLAAQELISSEGNILETAMKYGYESAAGFTKAFTRFHGATPSDVMRRNAGATYFAPLSINLDIQGGISKMEISYRMANIGDLKTVAELWDLMCNSEKNCGEDEYDEIVSMSKKDLTDPERAMFMAFDGTKAIGFSHVYVKPGYAWFTTDYDSRVGFLETVYVRPEYRKKGIARALVAMCENWSKEKNCTEFGSGCDFESESNLAFHLKTGFMEIHRIRFFKKEL